MGPKKAAAKKQRGQEAGEKEVLEEVDKEFYELQLADTNRKLARFRARCTELEEECEETKKALQKLDEDRADIIAYLKRTLQSKADEIVELQERLAALQQARETENAMFAEKIKNMEQDFKVMHEQLTSEIKLLNGKLNSLEEFRAQREELMNKFLTQEIAMAEQEERHKKTLYEIERKFIIAKDELKKDMEGKLLQLSLDFQNATQMRIAATTQRVIRENVAVNNELASLMESWKQLTDDVSNMKEKEKMMRLEIELQKDEKLQCLKRNEIQTRVIDKITTEHEHLLGKYTQMCYYQRRSEILEDQLSTTKKELSLRDEQLQRSQQLLHSNECERSENKQKLREALQELGRVENVLASAAKAVMDCAILDRTQQESDTGDTERSTLLNTLLDLFSSIDVKKQGEEGAAHKSVDTILVPDPMSFIYDTGDLGIILKRD